jgi:hypothetical protein
MQKKDFTTGRLTVIITIVMAALFVLQYGFYSHGSSMQLQKNATGQLSYLHNYVSEDITFLQGLLGVCFIMTGAVFWWTFIVYTIEQFRAKFFNVRQLYIINRITGVLLMIIAPISLLFFLMGISPFH